MQAKIYELILEENQIPSLKDVGTITDTICIRNAEVAVKLLNTHFELNKKAEEFAYVLAMNSAQVPNAIFEVAHGNVNAAIVGIREIAIRALLSGAVNVIFVHNHPSGNLELSTYDKQTTENIKKALGLLQITLIDSIIIGGDNFYSFRANDLL